MRPEDINWSRRALDAKKIRWAMDRWQEGYSWLEIADALFVTAQTLKVAIYQVYGKQNKRTRKPLVYKEDV